MELPKTADDAPVQCVVTLPEPSVDLPLDQIICGDNCDVLGTFPRDCIDLVVTSPPYDDLRTYGSLDWDFYGVAWQLKRVLKPGGVIVWVVNDATVDGTETGSSADQAKHFRKIGLKQHDTMIYQRVAKFPETTRYYPTFEYMFILSKGGTENGQSNCGQEKQLCGAKPRSVNATEGRRNPRGIVGDENWRSGERVRGSWQCLGVRERFQSQQQGQGCI